MVQTSYLGQYASGNQNIFGNQLISSPPVHLWLCGNNALTTSIRDIRWRLPRIETVPFVRSLSYMRECPTDVRSPQERIGGVWCWQLVIQRSRFDTRSTQTRTRIPTGHGMVKSIDDGAIHRGDAALGACRHCDARGDGRTDGADRRRGGQATAPRATQRGDGAARGRRADHGDRVDQDPASHFLRRRGLDPSRAGIDRRQGTRDASRRLRRHREGQGPPLEHV